MSKRTGRKPLTPRQEEILGRTLELVRERGIGGLTTRKIAEGVGFTEAALFRHYPTKQALLLALMNLLEDLLVEPIAKIAADSAAGAPERLERMVRHHTTVVRQFNSLPIILFAEASVSGDKALVNRMRGIFERYLSLLEEVVRAGQACGEIVGAIQPDCIAMLLLGAPAGLAIRHRLLPNAAAEDHFEEILIPFLRATIDTREESAT
jgi:TetR/AcrR family transcriptional regulator